MVGTKTSSGVILDYFFSSEVFLNILNVSCQRH